MATWQPLVTDNFTRPDTSYGASAFSTSGAGNNWIDQAGTAYKISGNKLLSSVATVGSRHIVYQIMRPAVENALHTKIVLRTGTDFTTNNDYYLIVRGDGADGAVSNNCYMANFSSSAGSITIYKCVAGVLTSLGTAAVTATIGKDWEFTLSATGSGTTTLVATIQNITDGGSLITNTRTDTTAAMQVSGRCGFVADYTGTNTPNHVASVTTYYDNAASMTATSGGVASLSTLLGAQTITVVGTGTTFTGGASPKFTMANETLGTITVTDDTHATIALTPGTTVQSLVLVDANTGAKAYIPLLTPTITLSPNAVVNATSGNVITITGVGTNFTGSPFTVSAGATITAQNVTSATSATITVTGGAVGKITTVTDTGSTATAILSVNQTVTPDNPALFFSIAGLSWLLTGSASAKCNAPGNPLKTVVTGTIVSMAVDVSALVAASVAAGSYPTLRYCFDSGAIVDRQLLSTDTSIVLSNTLAAGSHTLEIAILSTNSTIDRWTTPVNLVVINSLTANGVFSAPTLRPKRLLVFWDSIGEGTTFGVTGNTVLSDATQCAVPAIAVGLDAEYASLCYGGQGYAKAGQGNVPMLYDTTTPASSAWNRFWNGVTRLVGGLLSPAPDYIVSIHGTNDGLTPIADNVVTATVTAWLAAVRAAAPLSYIFVIYPVGQYKTSAIASGFAAYQAATPDNRAFLIDLGVPLSLGMTTPVAGGTQTSGDGTHPRIFQSARIGSAVVSAIRQKLRRRSGGTNGGLGS
jgi:hypothetical protein